MVEEENSFHSFPLYLLEELQVHGHLKETSHGAGAVRHEALLAEGDWFSLRTRKLALMTIDSPLLAKTAANGAASSETRRQMFCLTALACLSSSPVAINYIISISPRVAWTEHKKKSCQERTKACWEPTIHLCASMRKDLRSCGLVGLQTDFNANTILLFYK